VQVYIVKQVEYLKASHSLIQFLHFFILNHMKLKTHHNHKSQQNITE